MSKYQPETGSLLSTEYKMTATVAASATAREVLEASTVDEVYEKLTTYTEEDMTCPRVIVSDDPIELETDSLGKNILNVTTRVVTVGFFYYSPLDEDLKQLPGWTGEVDDQVMEMDHRTYAAERLSKILSEMMAVSGDPGYLATYDPKIYTPEMVPWSERFDQDEVAKGDDARHLWYGILDFNIR